MLGLVLALVAAAIAGTPVRADSNTAPTGLPRLHPRWVGTGNTLTVYSTQIRDVDGMASSTFAYQ